MPDASELAVEISRMSKEDQRKLLALLGSLISEKPDLDPSVESVVFDAIRTHLKGRMMPMAVFRKQRYYKSFREGSAELHQFIRTEFKISGGPKYIALVHVLLRMLVRQLKKETLPVSPSVLATHLIRIPDVCELAFPRYRESGLLPILLQHLHPGVR